AISLVIQLSYYSVQFYLIPAEINPPLSQIFHISIAITPSIGCLLVLSSHPSLRPFLLHFMRSRVYAQENSSTGKECSSDPSTVQIQSLSGVELVVPTENHRDAYFSEFRRQWG
ncbi:hypothetical protein PMAYCL1PPCAC_07333, partial [Pristionchus mayeri]